MFYVFLLLAIAAFAVSLIGSFWAFLLLAIAAFAVGLIGIITIGYRRRRQEEIRRQWEIEEEIRHQREMEERRRKVLRELEAKLSSGSPSQASSSSSAISSSSRW